MANNGANILQINIYFALHVGYRAVIPESFAKSVETIPTMRPYM